MATVVLDANVVIALLQRDDAAHARAQRDVRDLLARGVRLAIAAVAYAEALVHPLRAGRGDVVEEAIDALGLTVVPVDRQIGRRAAELRAERPAVRMPDALVWATAAVVGGELLTYDDRLAGIALP